ncbi:alpha/beta hydrolase, partial [Flavobacterium sp.]|uniref:alpha/beta hydrolase n=1 Tax=Flavobacterium sp. TaxID=239 RepID=UPI0040473C5A
MKKLALFIPLFLIAFNCWSQDIQFKNFESYELDNNRTLKIYIPPSYYQDSTKFYPLTIVLDAEILFDAYVGNAILFANSDEAPEQIIVGIQQNQYNERAEDCSYTKENSLPTKQSDAFYRFIRSELFTYFNDNYRVSPFKTIIGNTLTANFTNYFLIENYPGFNAYISINPSLAMDMPHLVNNKTKVLKDENIYYYLSNCKRNSDKKETTINAFNQLLVANENPKFKYRYDYFQNSTITSSVGQSISSALSFIFELYSPISKEEFESNIKDLSPPEAIAYLENKYVEIEYLFGSNLKIREKDI